MPIFFGNGPIFDKKKRHIREAMTRVFFEVPMACHFLNSGKERCCRTQSKYRKVTFSTDDMSGGKLFLCRAQISELGSARESQKNLHVVPDAERRST
nr:hypothetical protein [Escherichia coli]